MEEFFVGTPMYLSVKSVLQKARSSSLEFFRQTFSFFKIRKMARGDPAKSPAKRKFFLKEGVPTFYGTK
ncbi:hypothetical protein CH380_09895 [Leptospira adleri]|uniref:Uncharacterized protein n=1 Tax=Leptospira adleri TaxID=2023186 RepID=A0A2M9YPN4_9LEPT|nr:hypothetical protein CH380_09895 [Leptospira adleri]PJZ63070.1 hypothetical protein CH376_05255 [Leptospira adleri]